MVAADAGVFAREPEGSALAVDYHSGDYFFAFFRICQLGVGRKGAGRGGGTSSFFRTEPLPGGVAGAAGGFGGFVGCMTDLL